MSNAQHMIQDIHDILKSYYQVAWKRAVDVICMQAVEHHLISGPETPLKLFCSSFVAELNSEKLEEIAGEDHKERRLREITQKTIADLEMGKKILA